ncbi:MAG: phospho-N-acetylmuramoyl-pentapeptide-transferase [Mogibacterium sp.]|nr:phospho-N-acetylmuramoyl-pentapeptide-transferase [Mogibacterium sp.]
MIFTLCVSMLVSALLTKWLIPFLKQKQFGQYIREEGPKEHLKKAGTPTMGGVAIVAAITVGLFSDGKFTADKVVILLTMLAFAFIGFLDDYTKVAKKNNLGLTAKQKMLLQILLSVGLAVYMLMQPAGEEVFIPFVRRYVNFGWFLVPFVVFVEVAMANGVNLTDGLDGLASSVTAIVGVTFAFIGLAMGMPAMTTAGFALAGALVGFLIFNKYPAKIFMGDTGSMALGGLLSAVAVVSRMEFLLPIAGLIYVIEALSVIIQVTYFKRTGGKRFFRMAPIHHHFELGGMNERQIDLAFGLFTAVMCVIAYLSVVR